MITIVGIDPGITGGISVLRLNDLNQDTHSFIECHPMPTYKVHTGKIKRKTNKEKVLTRINARALAETLSVLNNPVVILEDVHSLPLTSSAAKFSFGHGLGTIEGVLGSLGLSYNMVTPENWQSAVWAEFDKVINLVPRKFTKGPNKGKTIAHKKVDTKATSLNAAQRIFPLTDFLPTKRSRKPSDGMYDSALIAEYGRVALLNGLI